MPALTSEEKVVIIKNWTFGFDVSYDRVGAKLIYGRGMGFEYTPTRARYDDMIDDAFKIVSNRVWETVRVLSNS